MVMAVWQRTIVDDEGNVIPNATITVRSQSSGLPLASLKSDRDGTVNLGNPFTADADGFAQFFVAGGAYRITATSGSFSRQWDYVAIGTQAETDAGLIPTPPPTSWLFDSGTTDTDPGSGEFSLNNATASAATEIYIDDNNEAGTDVSDWVETWDNLGASGNRGTLLIFDPDNPTGLFHIYSVSGSITTAVGYLKATLTWIAGTGSFVAGDSYAFLFIPTGAAGSVTGPGAVVDQHAVRFDGTSGNLIESAGTYHPFQNIQNASDTTVTLGANDGGSFVFNFPNPGTMALPDPGVVFGKLIYAFCAATSGNESLTISTPAGSLLFGDGTSASSMTLVGFGAQAIFFSDGSNWIVNSTHYKSNTLTHGRHTISIPASAMYTPSTAGAAAATTELVASAPINCLRTLAFDPGTEEAAFFMIPMPKSWDGGTIDAEFIWTATSGAGDVFWEIALRVFSEGDALEQAFGTARGVIDSLTTAGDLHVSGETSGGITPAGTPGVDSVLIGRISREAGDALDTLTTDALLLGIRLFIGLDASNDA